MWISTANRRWTGLGTMALKTRSTETQFPAIFSRTLPALTSITSPLLAPPLDGFLFKPSAPQKLP